MEVFIQRVGVCYSVVMEESNFDAEGCQCGELWDSEVVDLGEEDKTFVIVKTRAEPLGWVSLEVCNDCGQHWLVGTDSSHNDVNCLLRLDAETVERILQDDVWPSDFDRYETLLELARDAGHKVSYGKIDSNNHALGWDISRLAKERPGIRVTRLASLLNITVPVATMLAQRVVDDFGVAILFD